MPDQFKSLKEVDEFLKDRYDVDYDEFDKEQLKNLRKYEDHIEQEAKVKEDIENITGPIKRQM